MVLPTRDARSTVPARQQAGETQAIGSGLPSTTRSMAAAHRPGGSIAARALERAGAQLSVTARRQPIATPEPRRRLARARNQRCRAGFCTQFPASSFQSSGEACVLSGRIDEPGHRHQQGQLADDRRCRRGGAVPGATCGAFTPASRMSKAWWRCASSMSSAPALCNSSGSFVPG